MCLGVPSEGTGFRVHSGPRAQQGAPRFLESRVPGLQVQGFQKCTYPEVAIWTNAIVFARISLSIVKTYIHMQIHALVYTCMHVFQHPSIYSFVRSFVRLFMHLFMYSCIHASRHAIQAYIYAEARKHEYKCVRTPRRKGVCYKSGVDKPLSKAHMAERMSGEMASDCVCMGHSNKSLGTGRRSCQRTMVREASMITKALAPRSLRELSFTIHLRK